jgi:exopolysaccharide production protein ExoQ
MIASAQLVVFQDRPAASSAFSIAGLIGLYFGLRVCLTFLFFQSDPQIGAIVGVALNLLLLVPVAFYALVPSSFTLRQLARITPLRLVASFLLLALVSLAWSETSSRIIAFGYWTAMASDVALVLLLLRADPSSRAHESILKGYVVGVAILAVIAWIAPANSDLRLGNDEYLNPNAIGFASALAALLAQYFYSQGARWKWLSAALILTLFRSLSKTSIVAFIGVEVFFLTRTPHISRAIKLASIVAFTFAIAIFWQLSSAYFALYANNGTQAETLSGRVGIWAVTLGMALEEPWLGHGFHSFRAVIPSFGGFEPWHAHNELLHQFFVYGITGVILVVALYISILRHSLRVASPLATLVRQLLLLVVIRGFADTERFDLSFPLWAITALSVALYRHQESQRGALP